MKAQIKAGVVISARLIEEHGFTVAEVVEPGPDDRPNRWNLSADVSVFDLRKLPMLEPLDLELELTGYLKGYDQKMSCVSVKHASAKG